MNEQNNNQTTNQTPVQPTISPELKAENSKIATMFFITALFNIFAILYYKLFYKTDSVRFNNYINMLTNWILTSFLIFIGLVFLNLPEGALESISFLNLCYVAMGSGAISGNKEFKFIFSIKFFKEV